MKDVFVLGAFDDLRSRHFRLLEEASRLGDLHVLIWADEAAAALAGRKPKFPAEERLYIVEAIRYVKTARIVAGPPNRQALPETDGPRPQVWVVGEDEATEGKKAFCASRRIDFQVLPAAKLRALPPPPPLITRPTGRKKVIVTGCYDWLHSGHVRFFEEAASRGDLHVDVGSDANIRLLKGHNHPLFPEAERLYMVRSIRHVDQAFIGSGYGWLDAAPEMARIKPDIYLVNEDGDRPEKRAFCAEQEIEYVVLKRLPKEGLPRRESSDLRGF